MQYTSIKIPIPRLNDKQLDKLSDISSNLGLISIGSVTIPAALDKFNIWMLLLGLVAAIFCWTFSILLRR